ncbi:MAG: class I SAM-dependent methyltransferase [Candidatus Njordarchaeia archaeon]
MRNVTRLQMWIRVEKSLDRLAFIYDWINKLISFNQDIRLRRKIVAKVQIKDRVLELGCGPGSLAKMLDCGAYWGIDPLGSMIKIAKSEVKRKNYHFLIGYAESIPLPDNMFDFVLCSFSFRDFRDMKSALREIYRVLKEDGKLVILDINSDSPLIKFLYTSYISFLAKILPRITGNKIYRTLETLTESIRLFPGVRELTKKIREAGFEEVNFKYYLLGGIIEISAKKETRKFEQHLIWETKRKKGKRGFNLEFFF